MNNPGVLYLNGTISTTTHNLHDLELTTVEAHALWRAGFSSE